MQPGHLTGKRLCACQAGAGALPALRHRLTRWGVVGYLCTGAAAAPPSRARSMLAGGSECSDPAGSLALKPVAEQEQQPPRLPRELRPLTASPAPPMAAEGPRAAKLGPAPPPGLAGAEKPRGGLLGGWRCWGMAGAGGDTPQRGDWPGKAAPKAALLPEEPPQEQGLRRSAEELRQEDRLSVCSKLCYAIGGAPNQVATSATAFFLQIYLLDIARITPFHASLVLFIGKAWGAVTDPVAGFFISKSKWTKIGRLMPWMLGCTPFTIVSYFFMWYLPPFVAGRVVWYLTFYCLFQALTTLFQVPYSALTMFLSPDQKERDSATAYRMTVEVLGTLMGAALHGQIVASAHASDRCAVNLTINAADSSSSLSNASNLAEPLGLQSHGREVYMIAAGVIGGVYLFGIVILFAGVKERDDPYALNSDKAIPFFKGLRLTMKHGPYLKLTASFLLISTAVQLEQSNFVLFCTHAASLHNHFQYLVVTILVSAAVSIPFWQWFLQHFGKKSAACGISWMIPFAVMLVTIPNLVLAYVVAFVSGLSIASSLLLPWSMLPDVVDHFRLLNPHAKGPETIFYSSYVFFTKMSAGVGLGISAASLEFAGYKPGMCRQSSTVILTLKILIGAVPAILIVIGLSILLFYPITEKSRKETEFALELLRRGHLSTDNLSKNEEDTWI
ncbi:major facilitator superfamily domain-containing protein 2B isoform X2 [Gopherus evgoodei]|uniref:MFSD2 lysolipid transporter B, sphingolipid n=1 Tax=Gopherus evgoodei TaxID=1825980 RepID=A0A8C4VRS9_9SAUR|nr:major facilitator superfamily domain-containing protein 2B isoform X2 [Gopherus evgoodei]